jgi:hypothetical protein
MLSRANAIFRFQKYCDYFNFYPIDYEALVFHPKNIATIMVLAIKYSLKHVVFKGVSSAFHLFCERFQFKGHI